MLFETLCFAVAKKIGRTRIGERGKVCAPAPYRVRSIIPPADRIREQRREENFRVEGIFDTSVFLGIYGTRTRESLVNLSHNSEYLTNISPPTSEHKGKFSQARKKFIQTRCGQRDFKTFGRRRARKLVGYTATRVATELFVVYCNKLWWTAEPASLM